MMTGYLLLPVGTTALLATALILGSPWIERSYGHSFQGLSIIVMLISIIAIMQVFGRTVGYLLASIDEMWWGVLYNVLWDSVLIASTHFLVTLGARGLAFAYLIAYACQLTWEGIFLVLKMGRIKVKWALSQLPHQAAKGHDKHRIKHAQQGNRTSTGRR